MSKQTQMLSAAGKVIRFTLQQRIQHGLLAFSVLMLIITGFPIKYAYTSWAPYVVRLFGGFGTMFLTHLVFAVLMAISSLYHLVWLIYTFLKNGPSVEMIPTFKDFRDAFHHALYLLGIRTSPPLYGRYSYLEKFEYFAVIWGVIVMGLSGLMLWFPGIFYFFPRWAFGIARVVHSNEAFVCMLAIFMGHFFAVHFHPKVFPSSPVWWNGTVSLELLKEEHPLEYENLISHNPDLKVDLTRELSPWARSKPLIYAQIVLYLVIFAVLLYTFVPLFLHGLL
ncbi:MAG TPA: cytochrome b/b6 domain-containing protein [Clostridia bacterium]|jgi:formate dehydrogenase subunit gamma|nr:cytochrome b/b6 domain-containing protein [Clostridia bacterium]